MAATIRKARPDKRDVANTGDQPSKREAIGAPSA